MVLTKDFEVNGRILLSSLVLGDADILSLIILIHLLDGQLRTVIAKEVLLFFLILYLFSIPKGCRNEKYHDFDYRGKMFIFN